MHKKSKGISVFVSHILAIAILFVALVAVSSQMYGYYHSLKETALETQARILSQRISENVFKLYTNYKESDYEPRKDSNETMSEIYLNIPDKISGNNYVVSLENRQDLWVEGGFYGEEFYSDVMPYSSVVIDVEGNPSGTFRYPIYNLVSTKVNGSATRASRIKISYVRENSPEGTTDYIFMERVS